jgi:hypothetical protein
MRLSACFGILGIVALAGCEMEAPPPGPGWGGRPPHGQIDIGRAERACVEQAERQGLRVRRVGRTEILTAPNGRVVGAQTILRVTRGGRPYPVRCNYSFDSRTARLTPMAVG